MRLAWLGFHREALPALEALLVSGAPIEAVLTLRPDLAPRRSGGADYRAICDRHGVPLMHVTNINDPEALHILAELDLDILFVIGWHQIVRRDALKLARVGMIGAHASLLPHNRGSAPINWAIINGEQQTGNTLFWLNEDPGSAQIIDQTPFPITPYDTCATLYEKVAVSNREMLLRLLPRLLAGERPGRPPPETDEPVLPRRRPEDGCIDWTMPSRAVYNLIRGLTRPYPGAFSWLAGSRWLIWEAALAPAPNSTALPGSILGPCVSPAEEACGQLVTCGEGAVILLELEADDGTVLRGHALSDQPWIGERWRDEQRVSP